MSLEEARRCPYKVSEIISDLDESQKSIFWCQKKHGFPRFSGRLTSLVLGPYDPEVQIFPAP